MVTQYTTENLRDLKKLEGTWVCIRSENVEELLIELGISFILRQLVNCSKSCQDIIVRGTEVDITYDVGFCSNKMTVKLGEEVEIMRLNVRHKCMSRFEDGKLIVTQTPLNSEVKEQVIHRELTGEELIMTVFVGSVKCKRIFKRKTSDDELPLIRRRPANCCLMKLFAPKSDEK